MSKVLWGPVLLLRLTLGHRYPPCVQHRDGKAAPVPSPSSLSEQTDRHSDRSTATGHHGPYSSTHTSSTMLSTGEFHQPLCPPSDNPRRELFGHFHELWHFSVLPAGGSPLGARYSTHQPLFLDLAKHLKPSHSAEILCPHLPVNQAHKLFREAALSIFFGIPSY